MVTIRSNTRAREKNVCCHFYYGLSLQRHKSEQRNQEQTPCVIQQQPEYSHLQTRIFQ